MATVAGLLLIAVPLAFNAAFAMLAARVGYPDVLRRPSSEALAGFLGGGRPLGPRRRTSEGLAPFRAGGTPLVLLWWAFAMTAVAMVPLVVLLSAAIGDADPTLVQLATVVGVLAAAVQFLGLVRWPFLIPYLAQVDEEAPGEVVDIVFQAFNRYLGVAVGEHLG